MAGRKASRLRDRFRKGMARPIARRRPQECGRGRHACLRHEAPMQKLHWQGMALPHCNQLLVSAKPGLVVSVPIFAVTV
jgi:hypothetical protein